MGILRNRDERAAEGWVGVRGREGEAFYSKTSLLFKDRAGLGMKSGKWDRVNAVQFCHDPIGSPTYGLHPAASP